MGDFDGLVAPDTGRGSGLDRSTAEARYARDFASPRQGDTDGLLGGQG